MFVEEKAKGEVKELDEVSRMLLKAAAVMEKNGIAKRTLKDEEGRVCMLGAIYEVSGPIDWGTKCNISAQAWKRLKKELRMDDPCIWNNAPERTCAEVVAKLRAVAFSF